MRMSSQLRAQGVKMHLKPDDVVNFAISLMHKAEDYGEMHVAN